MERPNQQTLLGLPAETLNSILELLVYHRETGGTICPRPDFVYDGFALCISGTRITMVGDQDPSIPHLPRATPEEVREWESQRLLWTESPNLASNHTCTLNCLIQPPIAFVNRRLRQLSLSILFGSNTFHFELDNFELSKGPLVREVKRCPNDWWRAIGNENLKMIRCLTLVGRMHVSKGKYGGMMITYDGKEGDVQVKEVNGRGRRRESDNERGAREQKLQRRIADLRRDGLSVESIEAVVAALQTRGTRYLRTAHMARDRR